MTILANVVIPSVAGHFAVMLVLLIPIAMLEAIVLARRHLLLYSQSLALAFRANLHSTIVGLPLGYMYALIGLVPAGMFSEILPFRVKSVVSLIISNSIGYGGTEPGELDGVGFYLGTLLALIPYFLITLRIERQQIAKLRSDLDGPRLTATVRVMNDITYGLLAIPIVAGAIYEIIKLQS